MSLTTLDFESQYLHMNTKIGIILPNLPHGADPKTFYAAGEKYRVLWLLHGTYGDYSDWIRKSKIELYACKHNLIVVMPWNRYFRNRCRHHSRKHCRLLRRMGR